MSLRKMEENLGSGRSSVMSVLVGIICFVSHRHIFNYLKRRHSVVQLGVLNKILRSRGYLNSIVYNIRFLEMCLENSVAPKGLQRRVRKAKVYYSAVIERAFVRRIGEESFTVAASQVAILPTLSAGSVLSQPV